MQYHLSKDGIQTGPFSEAELRAKLACGEIADSDLALPGDSPEWQPLNLLLAPPSPPSNTLRYVVGWSVSVVLLVLLASLMTPSYCVITHQANQMKASSNCRQIIGLLMAFAAENNGLYPDSVLNPISGTLRQTSNDAFRALFQEGMTQDEKIFGSPTSRYNPDGNFGTAPIYEQALLQGENHWAMTAGLTNQSSSIVPLVFENPIDPVWPPRWDASAGCKPVRGRSWRGAKIIIGHNDASVEAYKLDGTTGHQPVAPGPDGKTIFTQFPEPLKVLDIAP